MTKWFFHIEIARTSVCSDLFISLNLAISSKYKNIYSVLTKYHFSFYWIE